MSSPLLRFVLAATAFLSIDGSTLTVHAGAPGLLVMTHEAAVTDAIAIEGQSRGLEVVVSPAPTGETPLVRAASAQQTLREAEADLALWIDETDGVRWVRAVRAEGELIRQARLDTADAVTAAAVAGTLLDELVGPRRLAPPPVAVQVDVNVHIGSRPTGIHEEQPAEFLAPPPADPSPTSAAAATPAAPVTLVPSLPDEGYAQRGWMLRGGVMFAGVAGGADVELGLYLTERLRLSLMTSAVGVFTGGSVFVNRTAGTLAYALTDGPNGRFDLGVSVGGIIAPEDVQTALGWTAGLQVSWTWELETVGLGFSLDAMVARVEDSDYLPWGYVRGFVEVPL